MANHASKTTGATHSDRESSTVPATRLALETLERDDGLVASPVPFRESPAFVSPAYERRYTNG